MSHRARDKIDDEKQMAIESTREIERDRRDRTKDRQKEEEEEEEEEEEVMFSAAFLAPPLGRRAVLGAF